MKPIQAEFIAGAAKANQFPNIGLPEIAFAGRSNVGKSSLLNSIVLRKKLAYISSTPGKTQQINFFNVENSWIVADLPGFGYAASSRENRKQWAALNYIYLEKRPNLKLVCALVDSRHDPMKTDLAFIEWLEFHKKPYLIVLTKIDKISKKLVAERKDQIDNLVQNCKYVHEVLPYSSTKFIGRDQLIGIIKKHTQS